MSQMNRHTVRLVAGSLTIGGFFLVSVTGVLMFFGLDRGLTSVVHEWFSWLFIAGSGVHIAVNIRPFMNYFRFPWSRAGIVVFLVILAASFSSWGIRTGHDLRNSVQKALMDAPNQHGNAAAPSEGPRDHRDRAAIPPRPLTCHEMRLLMIVFVHN